ncbi:MAG: hypothetical protein E7Z63_01110 [Thermoplasmata archaeon]|nr:hypothetical protein [Thermoplasmata archaeon]
MGYTDDDPGFICPWCKEEMDPQTAPKLELDGYYGVMWNWYNQRCPNCNCLFDVYWDQHNAWGGRIIDHDYYDILEEGDPEFDPDLRESMSRKTASMVTKKGSFRFPKADDGNNHPPANRTVLDAYDGAYYTIAGAGGDLGQWISGYQEMLDTERIGKVSRWVTFSGQEVNDTFILTGMNAFRPDLTFLAFPLDGLNVGRLAMFRLRMKDYWFNDLVDNSHPTMRSESPRARKTNKRK